MVGGKGHHVEAGLFQAGAGGGIDAQGETGLTGGCALVGDNGLQLSEEQVHTVEIVGGLFKDAVHFRALGGGVAGEQ